jgi:arginyl-tRNA synthetase
VADVTAALGAAAPATLALHPSERELIRRLLSFPGEMRDAADRRAPHRVATYALELGQAFAAFYRDAPVLNAAEAALRAFRLQLCVISQRTLARSLGLLGVSAPEHM